MIQILKKYLEVEFSYKNFQETSPKHLEQLTKTQTLIQITYLSKNTQKFQKVQNKAENSNQCKLNFGKNKKKKNRDAF